MALFAPVNDPHNHSCLRAGHGCGHKTHHRTRAGDIRWWRKHHPRPSYGALREAQASWYSPESSSPTLGCSGFGSLTDSTMEVAHKTLPCGTRVRVCLTERGPCAKAIVEDRGPYVAGREWDLNIAVARAIGFLSRGVGPVWVGVG
jgi:rare lipoprotein A (peptidoglycan hydrolase)